MSYEKAKKNFRKVAKRAIKIMNKSKKKLKK